MALTNPDLPPGEQPKSILTPLAQTFELIKSGGEKIFKLPEPVPSDWPVDMKMKWYPLFRLLRSPYFTEVEIGRLLEFKRDWESVPRLG